jgi:hypothetical protein
MNRYSITFGTIKFIKWEDSKKTICQNQKLLQVHSIKPKLFLNMQEKIVGNFMLV